MLVLRSVSYEHRCTTIILEAFKRNCRIIIGVATENKIVKVKEDDLSPETFEETSVVVRDREGFTHIMKNEELKIKAARAGDMVNDFASSVIDRVTNIIKSKAKEFYNAQVFEPSNTAVRKDSADIAHLGPLVTPIAAAFEGMETIISEQSYIEQVRLLIGYKRLLEEQINVIDSRIHFAKRVETV